MTDCSTRAVRRVLLPVDGSRHSERAFEWYLVNLHRAGDEVILFHAVESPVLPMAGAVAPAPLPPGELERLIEEKVREVKRIEANFRERAEKGHVKLEFKQAHSNRPGEAIVNAARSLDVATVVIGSRGLGKLRRTFLGSVSDYVLHHAGLPVNIVPPEK